MHLGDCRNRVQHELTGVVRAFDDLDFEAAVGERCCGAFEAPSVGRPLELEVGDAGVGKGEGYIAGSSVVGCQPRARALPLVRSSASRIRMSLSASSKSNSWALEQMRSLRLDLGMTTAWCWIAQRSMT